MCGCGANGKTPEMYPVQLPGGRIKYYSRQETAEQEALRTGGFVMPATTSAVSS